MAIDDESILRMAVQLAAAELSVAESAPEMPEVEERIRGYETLIRKLVAERKAELQRIKDEKAKAKHQSTPDLR